jgi:DNA-binding HxlR family transcriptional regulator
MSATPGGLAALGESATPGGLAALGASATPGASVASGASAMPGGFAVPSAAKCRIREILGRIGDKWSLFIIFRLGDGPQRFTTLKRAVDGISQRMLTVTLRGLERDGIVSRTMYPVMPPRVDYALTPLGHTLLDAVGALMAWVDEHLPEVDAARDACDARSPGGDPELPVPAPRGRQSDLQSAGTSRAFRQPGLTRPT